MILYRVSLSRKADGEHVGFEWMRTRREALAVRVELHDATIDRVEFDWSQRGLIEMLNKYAEHADNG